jgi:glycosyltransferase involved in cell wall biosynthesis
MPMKILMISRATLFSVPGGDTIQIQQTSEHLTKLNITVDIQLTTDKVDYQKYDLIHFFNIIRPADILDHIYRSKLPFVVSPIFVEYQEYDKKERRGLIGLLVKVINSDMLEYFKTIGRVILNGEKVNSFRYLLYGHYFSIKQIAKRAALLLPNSNNENIRFCKAYNVRTKYIKVPNAINAKVFDLSVNGDNRFIDHVLCVARFEGLKNQLNLIKAVIGTNLKLTLIGKPSPNHLDYYSQCKELANSLNNVQILDHIDQVRLSSIYKAAKVHVLPSWFETTGLSSLEAAAMGCNIVITRKGDTEEYFGKYAFYCEPDSIDSIRTAITEAYNSPADPELRKFIINNYTWEKAAEVTYNAYNSIIK